MNLKIKMNHLCLIWNQVKKRRYSPYLNLNINENKDEDKLNVQNLNSEIKDSSDSHPLINSLNQNINEVNNIDNLLLEEVFVIFCKYWNYDPDQLNLNLEKNEKGSKSKAKIEIMKEKNEL